LNTAARAALHIDERVSIFQDAGGDAQHVLEEAMGKRWMVAATATLVAAGCASTEIRNTWRNPQYVSAPPRNVLVVALVPSLPIRHQIESQMAGTLQGQGLRAVPVSQILPPSANLDAATIRKVTSQQGFDGLLVSRFKGTQEQVSYVPGTISGYDAYFGTFGPYATISPGYVQTTQSERMETSFFDTRGQGSLIWTATSDTFNSGEANQDVSKFVSTVMNSFDQQVLAPARAYGGAGG
jgi:hypothetical protein